MIKFLAVLVIGGIVGMFANILCLSQKEADDAFPDIENEDEPDAGAEELAQ
ncbi:MAG: hypothetical protein LIO70_01285 [Clostridiales bacterium]|nr:hypothetical protein [Clostridiales bacterium]